MRLVDADKLEKFCAGWLGAAKILLADRNWEDLKEALLTMQSYIKAAPTISLGPSTDINGLTFNEIVNSLEDQAQDKDSLVPADEPDSIFAQDAAALRAAVVLLRKLEEG